MPGAMSITPTTSVLNASLPLSDPFQVPLCSLLSRSTPDTNSLALSFLNIESETDMSTEALLRRVLRGCTCELGRKAEGKLTHNATASQAATDPVGNFADKVALQICPQLIVSGLCKPASIS